MSDHPTVFPTVRPLVSSTGSNGLASAENSSSDAVEIQQVQILDKVVDLAIVVQLQVPMVLTVQKALGDSTVADLGQSL